MRIHLFLMQTAADFAYYSVNKQLPLVYLCCMHWQAFINSTTRLILYAYINMCTISFCMISSICRHGRHCFCLYACISYIPDQHQITYIASKFQLSTADCTYHIPYMNTCTTLYMQVRSLRCSWFYQLKAFWLQSLLKHSQQGIASKIYIYIYAKIYKYAKIYNCIVSLVSVYA